MFELLVLPAVVRCDHDGRVGNKASQDWVRVDSHLVLREDDPEGRDIDWCPNRGTNIKRCDKTFRADVGYSTYVSLDGKPVVLGSLDGKTDGTPPMAVHYRMRDAGQHFVWVDL
jgi:hypothetical protein